MAAPEGLLSIVNKAATDHMEPDAALDCAYRQAKKHADFGEWSDCLIRQALLEMIYDVRHRVNVAVRRNGGEYGGPAKVDGSTGAVALALSKSPHLSYFIAGRCLGDILGEELPTLAANEQEKAETASFHVSLLKRLAGAVPEGKAVRDCFSETKLKRIFNELRPKAKAKAA